MITTDYLTLIPAYGRDYRNKADVIRHFLEGKDFQTTDLSSHAYLSIRDFHAGVKVTLRYANKTKTCVVTVPEVQ